jgi:hypothetical protein
MPLNDPFRRDGVTITEGFDLEDPEENPGAPWRKINIGIVLVLPQVAAAARHGDKAITLRKDGRRSEKVGPGKLYDKMEN